MNPSDAPRRGALSFAVCAVAILMLAFATNATAATPKVVAGAQHSCSLDDVGIVKCWGNNESGAVGDGTVEPRITPTGVTGLGAGIVDIAADGFSSCALLGDGSVKCWGANTFGALGRGSADALPHPVPDYVSGLGGVTQISGGYYGYCVVITDGTAKCWGANPYGEIGNPAASNPQTSPIAVQNLGGVKKISNGEFHACAVLNDGTGRYWGYDQA